MENEVSPVVIGQIDECGWDLVRGWAWLPSSPEQRLRLRIEVDGVPVGQVVADQAGPDLNAAGFGDGSYRFRFALAAVLERIGGDTHDIDVFEADTRIHVGTTKRLARLGIEALASPMLGDAIAMRVLRGTGIELGALDEPQVVGPDAFVRYVDRLPTEDLRALYPEIAPHRIVHTDIVDDAATLRTITDASCDFLIASNLIEHLEDPVAAIRRWTQVLPSGGVLFLIVPNRRNSVDFPRPATPLSHFRNDHTDGGVASRSAHFLEWASRVEGLHGGEAEARAAALEVSGYPIHFHVWDELSFASFIADTISGFDLPLTLEHLCTHGGQSETVVVLRKSGA